MAYETTYKKFFRRYKQKNIARKIKDYRFSFFPCIKKYKKAAFATLRVSGGKNISNYLIFYIMEVHN